MDLNSLISNNEDDEDDDDVIEDEDGHNDEVVQVPNANNEGAFQKSSLNFRDVEDSLRSFNGKDNYSIEKWVTDFEEAATLFGWNELQKFVFAKKCLTGVAKLYIASETGILSWKKLKGELIKEFATKVNSAQLHEALSKRKIKKEETVLEYFLAMKEMASRGNIEHVALIQHIIQGLPNDNHKMLLYGSKNLEGFKEKLRIYEEAKNDQRDNTNRTVREKPELNKKTERNQISERCFNCGNKGHRSTECKSKGLGPKCFKCNRFGHRANYCKEGAENSKRDGEVKQSAPVNNIVVSSMRKMYKDITIEGVKIEALVDTGCHVNILRQDAYQKVGSPRLRDSDVTLMGFGKGQVKSLGYFQSIIYVDREEFPSSIHVVPNNAMAMEGVIGNEMLSQAEVIINPSGITITRIRPTVFLTCMEGMENVEFDIGHQATHEQKTAVRDLVTNYIPKKTKSTNLEMSIVLKDEQPIYYQPRRLPFSEREIVDNQVKEWLQNGIIEPCSSEFASQVVVVKKKDGSHRICIDYRKLNKVVIKDRYPLPLIEDQLDRLQNVSIFSTIDLKNGFFHVKVDEKSKKYTAFVTHNGQFQFLRVPFGLCNSPSVFQRYINCIFRPLINDGIVLLYMDDLIIPASCEEEGLKRLKMVLHTAAEYGLEINKKKCRFLKTRIEFLGHIIEGGKILPSPEKIKAVVNFPEPTNVKGIQSFLGLTGYFRKFISHYSVIAKPLSDALRKEGSNREEPFELTESERQAFLYLKQVLSEKPVLMIYKQQCETELHTDASIDGYGAVLLQRCTEDGHLHPVYYMSKKTNPTEKKYSSYELEVLGVITALQKFRVYLLGTKFKIITDCSAFQKTMDKKNISTKIARWALLLEEFDYTIEHRSGSRMPHVDALSRYPVMTIVADGIIPRIKSAQGSDESIKTIMELLKEKPYEDYFIKEGILYKFIDGHEVLAVPKSMQSEIIKNYHQRGHFAVKKTEELIKRDFYIPKVREKIEKCISNCVPCILVSRKNGKAEGYLHPLTKEEAPLHTYHVDHLGPLESTNKSYKHIFAVIDGFTKFSWLYPTKSTTTKEVISKLEMQAKTFGNPLRIISDKGTAFTSTEFQEYCKTEGILHSTITTGLPRSNGQIERLNRVIISALSKLSIDDAYKWYKHVDRLQQVLNSTYHRSINTTPFELMIGVNMKEKTDLDVKQLIEQEIIADFKNEREDLRNQAKQQILKVQNENKRTYNLRRRPPKRYKINDLVAIKRTQFGPGLKLKPKFLGPYRILKVKPNDTYDVEKEGVHHGPKHTSTCAEFIKPWVGNELSSEPDET